MIKNKQKNKTYNPTAIDLFSGCGGLSLGLSRAGFQVIGAVEVNALAAKVYRQNHPAVPVWEIDIRNIDPLAVQKELGLKKGELSLLAGCPPCQGFSRLRTKNGALNVTDERNDLLFEFVRFIEILLPKALMMENVPSLADDERFYQFCEIIKEYGYFCDHKIVNAADYGTPQRRKRLIFLAGRGSFIPFAAVSKKRVTVRNAIADMRTAGSSGDPLHDTLPCHQQRVQDMICCVPKNGGSRRDIPRKMWLKCHLRSSGFKDVYGRMAWDDVAPTITSGCCNPSKGRFLHPEENRAITLREAAILQGFPPTYRFPVDNRGAVATMIGNALPPPLIAAHAKSIKKHLATFAKHDPKK